MPGIQYAAVVKRVSPDEIQFIHINYKSMDTFIFIPHSRIRAASIHLREYYSCRPLLRHDRTDAHVNS